MGEQPIGPIKLSIQSETGCNFTGFIRLIQGSESCACYQGPRSFPVDSLDLTNEPHPRFLVQGHILSVGGDALMAVYERGLGFLIHPCFEMDSIKKKNLTRGFKVLNLSLGPHKRFIQDIIDWVFWNQHQPPGCAAQTSSGL